MTTSWLGNASLASTSICVRVNSYLYQCDAKHQINAYLMVKVWTYGIDGSLQSSLLMPRRSSHGSSWLSELPLT